MSSAFSPSRAHVGLNAHHFLGTLLSDAKLQTPPINTIGLLVGDIAPPDALIRFRSTVLFVLCVVQTHIPHDVR